MMAVPLADLVDIAFFPLLVVVLDPLAELGPVAALVRRALAVHRLRLPAVHGVREARGLERGVRVAQQELAEVRQAVLRVVDVVLRLVPGEGRDGEVPEAVQAVHLVVERDGVEGLGVLFGRQMDESVAFWDE